MVKVKVQVELKVVMVMEVVARMKRGSTHRGGRVGTEAGLGGA